MKKRLFLSLLAMFIGQNIFAQSAFKERYYVKDTINYIEKYYDENDGEIKTKKEPLTLQSNTGKINPKILKKASSKKGLRSNVIFGEKENSNKLFINSWLIDDNNGYIDRDTIYYYELKNRQSVKINFRQWSFNALSVPLKARFGDKTEFSTGANLGALLGYTWGQTNFIHRKAIGNKQYDTKWTFGLFLGTDKLEFSFKNETNEEVKVKTAYLSSGLGVLYSYQKFTFGITGGFDFGLGENSSKWDYQSKPWVGTTLGYSLFSF